MTKLDVFFIPLTIVVILWWWALVYSGCELLDSPFGFVRGCYNYGINWNSFMAPVGFFVIILTPFSLFYSGVRVVISLLVKAFKLYRNSLRPDSK